MDCERGPLGNETGGRKPGRSIAQLRNEVDDDCDECEKFKDRMNFMPSAVDVFHIFFFPSISSNAAAPQ
jgi:hypothetical protein